MGKLAGMYRRVAGKPMKIVRKNPTTSRVKSSYDHVSESALLASDRQVSLELSAVRKTVQEGLLPLHWVPTWRRFADGLTKKMADKIFCIF